MLKATEVEHFSFKQDKLKYCLKCDDDDDDYIMSVSSLFGISCLLSLYKLTALFWTDRKSVV